MMNIIDPLNANRGKKGDVLRQNVSPNMSRNFTPLREKLQKNLSYCIT